MMSIKTPDEIQIMSEGGKITAGALKKTLDAIEPGVATADLDSIADAFIVKAGAYPSFKTVRGYKYATCININEGLVHGVPGDYRLNVGDLVSVDLGALYKGFHTDMSYTVEVGSDKRAGFLEVGRSALSDGIAECIVGNRVGDISNAIQRAVEKAGFSVSRDLVGHGVGRQLHEAPHVPGYGKRGSGQILIEGMTLAIEVIYQMGGHSIKVADDGWTVTTADKSLSALFEHTVAVAEGCPVILTRL
ncbi:type I methionyl aminopeptidase [candidate division WWE3 bacterium]|nr:type I methionyl aminopeptidase [candidate division WWE3 bacterium]